MKKMIFIIMAMMMCIVAKGQPTITKVDKSNNLDGGNYCIDTFVATLNSYNELEIVDCIDWYNSISLKKIEYDTIVFDYPFYVFLYKGNECVAKMMYVYCEKMDVYSKTTIDSYGIPHTQRVIIKGSYKSTYHNDLYSQSFFIIPFDKNKKPFFCGVLMSDIFYKHFVANMYYSSKGVEELLAKQSSSKSLR